MTEPTLRDCINYMKQQLKGMEKYPKSYEFNIPYYRKTIELLEEGRQHGEWIRHIDDLYPEESTEECSVCHEEQRITGNDDNFCPNCGADMREEGDSDA